LTVRTADCGACVFKPQCTAGNVHGVSVGLHETARQAAKALVDTDSHNDSRRRRLKVEMLFAHLKQ
jgi:hypothetical protein